MSETRIGEPRQEGPQKVRKVRRNRKDYGELRYYPGKITVYWTKRSLDQYHRQFGGWLVDADTISAIKLYGVTHVGLLVEDGSKLLTPISTFSPGTEAVKQRSNTYIDERGNRGAMCWHVPTSLWAVKEPPEDVKSAFLMEQMHIKRGRRSKSRVTV